MSKPILGGPFVIHEAIVRENRVELVYLFGDPHSPTHRFSEMIEFDSDLTDSFEVRRAVRILHLVAGVSYYKSIAPTPIVVDGLDEPERDLVMAMYDQGLREFGFRNGLKLPMSVDIVERNPRDGDPDPAAGERTARHGDGVLIPVGGGKDSALVADLIPDGVLMTVNPTGAHEHLAERLGRPLVRVTRTLDPQLRDLVAAGALNGHVPVTAINSAIAVTMAASTGFGFVAMGLERSASEPTLVVGGIEVNHQFSKSMEGERLLNRAFTPTRVEYFSLLRPMTELAIGVAVAERGLAGDIVSCNRAFTIWSDNDASRSQRPCGECAKCLFTALMLSPALEPAEVRSHFGRDLLDEPAHIDPVRELWSAEKPFDCVGERHETAAALMLLSDQPEWSGQVVPKALRDDALQVLEETGARPRDYLEIGSTAGLPALFRPLIEQLRRKSSG